MNDTSEQAPSRREDTRRGVIAAVAITILLGGLALFFERRFEQAREGAIARWTVILGTNATLTAAAVGRWIAEREGDAKVAGTFTQRLGISPQGSFRSRTEVEHALTAICRAHGYAGVWIVSTSGDVLAASESAPSLHPNELEAAVRVGSKSGKVLVGPTRLSDSTYVMSLALFVGDEQSNFTVVTRIDASRLFQLVPTRLPTSAAGQNALVSRWRDSVVFLTQVSDPPAAPGALRLPWASVPRPVAMALSGHDTVMVAADIRGVPAVIASRHVAGTTWAIVRKMDVAEVLASDARRVHTELVLALAALLLLAVSPAFVAHHGKRRTQRAIRESRIHLSAIVDSALDAIITTDSAHRVMLFNPAAERMFGILSDDARSRSLSDFLPQNDAEANVSGLYRAIQSSDVSSVQFGKDENRVGRRADGTEFPVEGTISTAMSEGKQLFSIIMRDISALRESEEARRVSEERFRRAFLSTGIGMAIASLEGRYLEVNPAFAAMLGFEPKELVGRTFHDVTFPEDLVLDTVRQREALAGQREQFEREKRYIHRDGHVVWVNLSVALVKDRMGRPSHFITHVQDISLRRQVEAALRESEASYRAFVENSPFGIYRSSLDGRFLEVNPAVVRILGYDTAEEVLALDMTSQVYVDPTFRAALLKRERGNRSMHNVFAEWKRKDGAIITVRLRARHVTDDDGNVLYIETFLEDVTPLRAAEGALRHAEKLAAVGQLVSGVAHELNNPLSAIMHFVEDLQQDERTASDREALTLIHEQARRSRAIVRDLLAFVRDRLSAREQLRGDDVLRIVTKALTPQVKEVGATLSFDANGTADVWIDVDRAGLEQVIANVVINAAQAAGRDGSVRIHSSADADTYRITVDDSGPGIPPEVMPRIFEPFFSTKPTGVGTGLGLPVSLGIVTQLGGTLRAETRTASDGGGARFIIALPCVAPPNPSSASSLPAPLDDSAASSPPDPQLMSPSNQSRSAPRTGQPGANATSPRVLIIDDEAAIRTALARFFTRRGWSVDEAAEGKTGIDKLLAPENTYDAIISDLRMPGFSGIELHDRLEIERPDLLDRLIFSTGDGVSGEAASFVARTRCPVLLKPFELAMLAETIARMQAASSRELGG